MWKGKAGSPTTVAFHTHEALALQICNFFFFLSFVFF